MKSPKKLSNALRLSFVFIILLILLGSAYLRYPGFYLPRNHGDQIAHLALAMKLDNFGFSGYNLRGVNVAWHKYFINVFNAPPGSRGNLLKGFENYDGPLFHKPPLFIYALMFSHRLFASDMPYGAVNINLGSAALSIKPKLLFEKQFYCTLIPVVFSLLLVVATFLLGKTFFSPGVGICAAILLSVSPIELLSSQRIWADGMTSFFVTSALLLYYLSRRRISYATALFAGISTGLAILTKPTGHIVFLIVLVYEIWHAKNINIRVRYFFKTVFNKMFLIFFVTSVLIALPWYWQLIKFYGSLFHFPVFLAPGIISKSPFHQFVQGRPWFTYLANIPAQTPIFILVYFAIFRIFKKRPLVEGVNKDKEVLLFIWISMFLTCFWIIRPGVELRYILPAYPAISVLSANALGVIHKKINKRLGLYCGWLTLGAVFIISCLWSIILGLNCVFDNVVGIKMPF